MATFVRIVIGLFCVGGAVLMFYVSNIMSEALPNEGWPLFGGGFVALFIAWMCFMPWGWILGSNQTQAEPSFEANDTSTGPPAEGVPAQTLASDVGQTQSTELGPNLGRMRVQATVTMLSGVALMIFSWMGYVPARLKNMPVEIVFWVGGGVVLMGAVILFFCINEESAKVGHAIAKVFLYLVLAAFIIVPIVAVVYALMFP